MITTLSAQSLPPIEELIKLAEIDESSIEEAILSWKANPNPQIKLYVNILQAEPLTDTIPEFTFDKKIQRYRYRDTGRFLSQQAVQNLTQKAISQTQTDVGVISDLLVQGKISLGTWEGETARSLKILHTQETLLGKGGEKQVNQRDYGLLGSKLKGEYKYLRGFAEDLASGEISEAQFRWRTNLYIQSARGSYERSKAEAHIEAGYQWERRIRLAMESCSSCSSYAAKGWQPIGTLPNPTENCECIVNCKCIKEFANKKPADFLLANNFGWLTNRDFQ